MCTQRQQQWQQTTATTLCWAARAPAGRLGLAAACAPRSCRLALLARCIRHTPARLPAPAAAILARLPLPACCPSKIKIVPTWTDGTLRTVCSPLANPFFCVATRAPELALHSSKPTGRPAAPGFSPVRLQQRPAHQPSVPGCQGGSVGTGEHADHEPQGAFFPFFFFFPRKGGVYPASCPTNTPVRWCACAIECGLSSLLPA